MLSRDHRLRLAALDAAFRAMFGEPAAAPPDMAAVWVSAQRWLAVDTGQRAARRVRRDTRRYQRNLERGIVKVN